LRIANLEAFVTETVAIALGAIIAAYFGVLWLRRLSAQNLGRIIFVLLVILGLSMIVETFIEVAPVRAFATGYIWRRWRKRVVYQLQRYGW
jgi:hypothetical protein